ncbi:MAG: class I SAM-dependent methyltransferase, partial [Nodosilinea sp.]
YTIAPDLPFQSILEVGGGQGGLTALLYPKAHTTNLDLDPKFAQAPCNQKPNVEFVCGDATHLPFADDSFDAVTMFDVLEHIPNDKSAIAEAWRVLKPGGSLLVSTPNENWQFPYYKSFRLICPLDTQVMAEWGHVRRGYTQLELEKLVNLTSCSQATFINPITVINHDIAFSKLPRVIQSSACAFLFPLTWIGYVTHDSNTKGTETAYMWKK